MSPVEILLAKHPLPWRVVGTSVCDGRPIDSLFMNCANHEEACGLAALGNAYGEMKTRAREEAMIASVGKAGTDKSSL